ncbi:hypothetical protein SteCoe_25497 [Stentor coeruleus]|uniref:Major facilitator superfamily (MFS) profile domain-containing protein n=1 Tax=Stentor coeruleus TaxID=5963 RepID=A0A1R2BF76_9CILI|nr:hypothetical protein SteCoe_25497 [Stentor coeruleus]
MEQMTIDNAIAKVSGNHRYQKRIIYILCLSQLSLSIMIMGTPYMIPSIDQDCDSLNICSIPDSLTNSATFDFQLFNEKKYLIGLVGTSYFAGMITGVLFLSWFSDTYGRIKSIKYFTIIGVPVLAFIAFSWSIWVIIISYFFVGLLEIGIFVPSFILLTENSKASHRNFFSGIFFSIWGIFTSFISILYLLSVPWRFTIIISIFTLLCQIFLIRYVHESPHFLLANHKNIDETIKVLNAISIINGEGPFTSDIKHVEIEENVSHSYLSFIKYRHLFIKILICTLLWFSIVLSYYSMLFIMPSLFPNLYVEGAIMGLAEAIGSLLTTYSVNKLGRKKCTFICFLISGLCFTTIWAYPMIFSDNQNDWGILALWTLGRFFISSEYFVIYIYTVELFPTRIRNMAYGICNFIGRIAGMISSNMITICEAAGISPVAVLAITMIMASVISCFLEETLGKNMMEFVEEDENNYREENCEEGVSYNKLY